MGLEASKTKKFWDPAMFALLQGDGIDIGCGPDPILPTVDRFDQAEGDANEIEKFVAKRYDFVFSAHCLEHMRDPKVALQGWFNLVKPGGHLIVLVPDENLYEQGCYPSLFNTDHKWTFRIGGSRTWSPRSIDVLELGRVVGGKLLSAELQDEGYDRRLQRHFVDLRARLLYRYFMRFKRAFKSTAGQARLARLFFRLGAAIDQTSLAGDRLAQIQFVIQKRT